MINKWVSEYMIPKDLIIIMGSLEHVYDPNLVMQKCEDAIKKKWNLSFGSQRRSYRANKKFF